MKKALNFVVAALLIFIPISTKTMHPKCVKAPLEHTAGAAGISPDLTAQYSTINFKYFQGTLPQISVVLSNQHSTDMGVTLPLPNKSFVIIIFSRWAVAPVTQTETLMHEMCHVDMEVKGIHEFNVHGPHWQNCMLNLAKEGAFHDVW